RLPRTGPGARTRPPRPNRPSRTGNAPAPQARDARLSSCGDASGLSCCVGAADVSAAGPGSAGPAAGYLGIRLAYRRVSGQAASALHALKTITNSRNILLASRYLLVGATRTPTSMCAGSARDRADLQASEVPELRTGPQIGTQRANRSPDRGPGVP